MYIARSPPKHGDRCMIQALVKLDSWQSIESYDKQGRPLHLTEAQKKEYGAIQPGECSFYGISAERAGVRWGMAGIGACLSSRTRT